MRTSQVRPSISSRAASRCPAAEAGPARRQHRSAQVGVRQSVHELIEPAQVAGSRVQFTVWVTDVDAVCAELAERGVELLNGPMDRAWGQRTAAFADPAGHVWEVAQPLG